MILNLTLGSEYRLSSLTQLVGGISYNNYDIDAGGGFYAFGIVIGARLNMGQLTN